MENPRYEVQARWDDEAQVWVAESDKIPGLITEAESIPELVRKLRILIPELLVENGVALASNEAEVDVRLLASYQGQIRIPAANLKGA
jgi:predicted RNase H-like HicB family nuclease